MKFKRYLSAVPVAFVPVRYLIRPIPSCHFQAILISCHCPFKGTVARDFHKYLYRYRYPTGPRFALRNSFDFGWNYAEKFAKTFLLSRDSYTESRKMILIQNFCKNIGSFCHVFNILQGENKAWRLSIHEKNHHVNLMVRYRPLKGTVRYRYLPTVPVLYVRPGLQCRTLPIFFIYKGLTSFYLKGFCFRFCIKKFGG